MEVTTTSPQALIDQWNAEHREPHLYLCEKEGEAFSLSIRFPGSAYRMDDDGWSAFKNGIYTKSKHSMMVATDIIFFWNGAVDIAINPYVHKKDNSHTIIGRTISWLMEELFPKYQKTARV